MIPVTREAAGPPVAPACFRSSDFRPTRWLANAVRHTDGPAALRVSWSPSTLRIDAWDANPEPPEPPQAWDRPTTAEDGRGLALVRACADRWGRPRPVGELVCGASSSSRWAGC
ncbi:ATP-binding protein [Streptomyces sp. MBT53]|uniref:ATP-binding protein n=1 Tax=Streptomyces sp. MBT53 TaxID=1488384 RepID=UPI0027D9EDDE|nr:ATP-binding protein [Streptomyces sp. MBT53]